jgi:hypothetical protein
MSKWKHKNKIVDDVSFFPEGCIGFIYKVCDEDGKCYIGQKSLFSTRRTKTSKNNYEKLKADGHEVKRTKNKKNSNKGAVVWDYRKVVTKESNWKSYQGSNIIVKKLKIVDKEIIDFAFSKKQLTYLELKWMFHYNVLESSDFYNDNILGKFYGRDIL